MSNFQYSNDAIAQVRAEVLAKLRATEEELLSDLQSFEGVLLGMGFVVTTGGEAPFAMKFDISPEGKLSNPRVIIAKMATRFDVTDATRIAATVTNGNGEPGRAMHVTTCIAKQLANVRDSIRQLESL